MRMNEVTTGNLLLNRAEATPEVLAIVEDSLEMSYRELADRAIALAKGLVAHGVKPGDRVALLMPNSIDYAASFYACGLAGAIAVNVNARLKQYDLARLLEHCGPTALITTDVMNDVVDFVALVLAAVPDWAQVHPIILSGSGGRPPAVDIDQLIADGRDALLPDVTNLEEMTALLLYTSGTTGHPKGCEIRHRALIRNWSLWRDAIGIEVGDAVWVPCPFFHIGGVGPLVGVIAAGATILTARYFDAGEALRQIEKYRPAHLFPAFPALTLGVLRLKEYERGKFGFVRTVHSVAPPETQFLVQSLVPEGAVVTSNFGMTEGAGPIAFTDPNEPDEIRLRSTGTAFPGYDVRIADPDNNRALPAKERGEIQFRSATAFHAYFNDPTETAATILAEGWIKTGDLGTLDEAGHLAYLGRIKDMIKVGGENVSPLEVESVLSTHPAVLIAQVVARDDERLHEVPVAFVELIEGKQADERELIEWLAVRIASFKVPRAVIFIDEWPLSATKILKSKLREIVASSQE